MSRKNFIKCITDLFNFIKENRSKLVKEKLLSVTKAHEFGEFVVNYCTADAAADALRLRLYLEDIWQCITSMSRKLDKRLTEMPELQTDKTVKQFEKRCHEVEIQTKKNIKGGLKKAIEAYPLKDFFRLVTEQASGKHVTAEDIVSALSMFPETENNKKQETTSAKEQPFHGQTAFHDEACHPVLGKPLNYITPQSIGEDEDDLWLGNGEWQDEEDDFEGKLCERLNLDDYDWQSFDGWVAHPIAIYKPAIGVWKYRLRISLDGIKPAIWREIEVPSTITLPSLAAAILLSMGWTEEHLHQFIVRQGRQSTFYVSSMQEILDGTMPPDNKDGLRYCIGDLLKRKGDKVTFEYDYGDCWLHTVALVDHDGYGDEKKEVRLLAGERACPPNDCGGVSGYQRLCLLMEKPASAEALEEMEWLGYRFDPELFPLKKAQRIVKKCNR